MDKLRKACSTILLLASAFLVSSCGNPHLVSDDLAFSGSVDLKAQLRQEQLANVNVIRVENSEGKSEINFSKLSLKIEIHKLITVISLSDKEIPLKLTIEKGEAFFFHGGKAPGINGNCGLILSPNQSCTIDISFQASNVGIFEDNLLITNAIGLKVTVPLYGERVDVLANSNQGQLGLVNPLEFVIDFGEVATGSTIKKMVEINNSGDKDVKISSIAISDLAFSVTSNGTCTSIIKSGKCTIEISFNPKEAKLYEGNLTLKEENERQLNLKLIAKAHNEIDCSDKSELKIMALKAALKSYPGDTFPYLQKSVKTEAKLVTLYGAEYNTFIPRVSLKTVKDAQVISTFSLSNEFSNITDIEIKIDGFKVITDSYKDTEMLCLSTSKFKRCSGRTFSLKEWFALSNPAFWNQTIAPVSEKFETILAQSEVACGQEKCQFIRTSLSFKEIFKLSTEELQELGKEKIINIIVTDDTRLLSTPTLTIKTEQKKTCIVQ